ADPREAFALSDFPRAQRPGALVLTEGAAGGTVQTETASERFLAPERIRSGGGAYGAGDSFAGALVFLLAVGVPLLAACARAGRYGAAVLSTLDPLDAQLALQ